MQLMEGDGCVGGWDEGEVDAASLVGAGNPDAWIFWEGCGNCGVGLEAWTLVFSGVVGSRGWG